MNILGTVFHTIANSKVNRERLRDNEYKELDYSPYLFSSSHLNSLMEDSEDKEEHDSILDHMYRFDACEVDSYRSIESKIIKRYW
ncbi:hypothetical protein FZC79_10545 [Rossellomorea vietnamensis]|uniref:Uncharacterized protein n=1 Tax=Rossellomorea vietnamensis TaxID=218284 RepID=A0A5D4KE18_9BACI|nr:hypothetical protein [Rossellomorea vietnamensis]TYR75597.1 hypothetical protein FZC79_10545 [Rossellomorea vietnamensis]